MSWRSSYTNFFLCRQLPCASEGLGSVRWAPCRLPLAGLRMGAPLLLLPGVGPRPAHTRTPPSL